MKNTLWRINLFILVILQVKCENRRGIVNGDPVECVGNVKHCSKWLCSECTECMAGFELQKPFKSSYGECVIAYKPYYFPFSLVLVYADAPMDKSFLAFLLGFICTVGIWIATLCYSNYTKARDGRAYNKKQNRQWERGRAHKSKVHEEMDRIWYESGRVDAAAIIEHAEKSLGIKSGHRTVERSSNNTNEGKKKKKEAASTSR